MRKIVVFNLITVDGYFAGPKGEIDWHNYDEEMGAFTMAQTQEFGTLMFGEITYELMASYWPTDEGMKSEPVVANLLNTLPKIVFSKKMEAIADGPIWKNVTVFNEIKKEEIAKLKEGDGKDIAIFGSGTIVQQLTDLGLIDEYRLLVNPLLLGEGKPLFADLKTGRHDLRLINTKVFKNGNVLLCYEPIAKKGV